MISTIIFALAISAPPTTIYFVRHAEKVLEPKTDDPDLTDIGKKRAQDLVRVLRDAKIGAVYSTPYQRTRFTAKPIADKLGHKVVELPAKDPKTFVKQVVEKHPGQTVLIVGHSNTIPEMLKELGVKQAPTIDDKDYDGLYVVIRDGPTAEPVFLFLHYGQ